MAGVNDFLNGAVGNIQKLGSTWADIRRAEKGIPSYQYMTQGADSPSVMVGQAAAVETADKEFISAIREATGKAAGVAGARELRLMMPYIVGGSALALTIWLLTKKG